MKPRLVSLALSLALLTAGASVVTAQSGSTVALPDPHSVTFADIHAAESNNHYSLLQYRFGLTTDPRTGAQQWLGLVEELEIAPAPAGSALATERFDLRMQRGVGLDAAEEARQASLFDAQRSYLYRYGTFRVHDPVQAEANYTLHFQYPELRLGRTTYRFVVMPADPTRNCWILNLDVETGYPLARSEYTSTGQLIGLVTVAQFAHGAAAVESRSSTPNWWATNLATSYATTSLALESMASGSDLEIPAVEPQNHVLSSQQVLLDPVTGKETLALEFTDGVRCILLMQTPNVAKPKVLPEEGAYGIFEFEDMQNRQLLFHVNGKQFIVIGNAAEPALDRFADAVLRSVVL